jgi:hypothetical protein
MACLNNKGITINLIILETIFMKIFGTFAAKKESIFYGKFVADKQVGGVIFIYV